MRPPLGRGFLPEEGTARDASPVAVLSHRLWKRNFGGDAGIVGRTVRINNYPFTVVGVAPEGFTGIMAGFASDVWVPIKMLLGMTAGLAAAAVLSRVLTSFLVGVNPLDPAVYACVATALMSTALLACYLPARRAAAMDPASALRHE